MKEKTMIKKSVILLLILVTVTSAGNSQDWLKPSSSISFEIGSKDFIFPMTMGVAISNDNSIVASGTYYLRNFIENKKESFELILTGESWVNPRIGWKTGIGVARTIKIFESSKNEKWKGTNYYMMP